MKIFIVKISRRGPNGDRALKLEQYYDYEIHVAETKHEINENNLLVKISGYDHWWSHIEDRTEVSAKTLKEAHKFLSLFNADCIEWVDLKQAIRERAFAKLTPEEIEAISK